MEMSSGLSGQPHPALFLDRDGVINRDPGYLHRIEDVVFLDGIFELVRMAVRAGLVPVVVTNQAGIGRGYYTEAQFATLMAWMRARFVAEGAPLAAVYHCPDHPDGIPPWRQDSFDRKPNPGMLLRARSDLNLDLARSYLIGDQPSDVLAGRNAGVGTVICLAPLATPINPTPDFQAATLAEIHHFLHARLSPIANPSREPT